MRNIAYIRVSTEMQNQSGLGIAAQREQIEKAFGPSFMEFVEIESGDNNNRPKLQEAIRMCLNHDCFISIAKQDRISRDTLLISTLIKNKVEFKAADNPNATDLIKFIYAALSQEELAKIRSRTRDALAAKQKRGEPLGINPWTEQSKDRLAEILANARKNRTYTKPDPKKIDTIKILKNAGVPFESIKDTAETLFGKSLSRATVYNYLAQ